MKESDSSHILLIGQDPSGETELVNCFRHLDQFRVHHTTSETEAVSLIYEADMDMVIINVDDSFVKSFETAMMLRNTTKGSRIPILFITEKYPGREIPFSAIKSGPFDVLIKPLNPFILKTKCELFLRISHLEKTHDKKNPFADAYKWIFNNLPFSMLVTDNEGVIIEINTHFLKKLALPGYYRDEYIGKNIFTEQALILPELVQACRSIISGIAVDDKKIYRTESTDDMEIFFTVSGSPLMKDGDLSGSLLIHHDITERIKTEQALTRSKKELEEANNELQRLTENLEAAIEQANKMAVEAEIATISKSGFLASMSHEIRTPLNAVIGFTELVLDSSLSDEQREYIESIRSSSVTFLELINDILDFSKIEAKSVTLESIPFNLEKTIEDVFTTISMRAYEKNIDLSYRIDPVIPEYLIGDPVRIKQILINLIGNAIKFTPTGHIVLRVERIVESGPDGLHLRFSVSDTGIGIAEHQKSKIFKPFSQASESINREYGGTGLGLAITKQLVELMSGKIWIESPNPESITNPGTVFHFTAILRLAETPSGHVPSILPDPAIGKRILVVEENPVLLTLYTDLFKDSGFESVAISDHIKIHKKIIEFISDSHPVEYIFINTYPLETNPLYFESLLNDHPKIGLIIAVHPAKSPDLESLRHFSKRFLFLKKPVRKTVLVKQFSGNHLNSTTHIDQMDENSDSFAEFSPLRVLLVEDNKINQKVATKMLIKMGHTVRVADNGKEAVDIVQTEDPFHIIFMDGQMPVMDGFQATEIIRRREKSHPGKGHIPIIALTANAMKGDRERFIEAGMDDYISKPVKYSDLVDMISRVMTRQLAGDLTADETSIHPETPEF